MIRSLLSIPLAACQGPSGLPLLGTHLWLSGQAGITGQFPGQATFVVRLVYQGTPRSTQNVQGVTWTVADLTLSNSDGTLLKSSVNNTGITKASFTPVGNTYTRASVFSGLVPGSGYRLDVSLKNSSTVTGSGFRQAITLASGTNGVTVIIDNLGQISSVANAADNFTKATDSGSGHYVLLKGADYDLSTGFAASEAGVDHMDVYLGHTWMYPASADTKIDTVTSAFDKYTFRTGTNIGSAYLASNLTAEATGDTITFKLYDSKGIQVGEAPLKNVDVVEPAQINLTMQ